MPLYSPTSLSEAESENGGGGGSEKGLVKKSHFLQDLILAIG